MAFERRSPQSGTKGRTVILDRDGVINRDSDAFIKSPAEFEVLPGSLAAIASLCRAGYRVIIATNQSGIARGLFTTDELDAIHERLRSGVADAGGHITDIVYCPHGPDDGCDCRKPRPGLLHQIEARYGVDWTGLPIIGDSLRDLEAARAVGALPILVRTGNGQRTEDALTDATIAVFDDLAAAAGALIDRRVAGAQ